MFSVSRSTSKTHQAFVFEPSHVVSQQVKVLFLITTLDNLSRTSVSKMIMQATNAPMESLYPIAPDGETKIPPL
jgi:hypothetical protein